MKRSEAMVDQEKVTRYSVKGRETSCSTECHSLGSFHMLLEGLWGSGGDSDGWIGLGHTRRSNWNRWMSEMVQSRFR